MTNNCGHIVDPFSVQEPTEALIAEYKLYLCEVCHKWFSFIGVWKEGQKSSTQGDRVADIILKNNWIKMQKPVLERLVISTLKDNEHIYVQYRAGNEKALHALVGLVMEQAEMRADAKDVISLIRTEERTKKMNEDLFIEEDIYGWYKPKADGLKKNRKEMWK